MRTRRPSFLNAAFLSILAFLTVPVGIASAAEAQSPAGKFFVSEIKGDAVVSADGKINPLAKKATFHAEGAVIETKANASASLVFSNGMAISVGENARFEVKKFTQEPFEANRNDLDVEPSATQTSIRIVQGTVALCTSRMVAGSTMTYSTPHGSVNIRGHKVMIQVDENETRVFLLEGDVTVVGDDPSISQTLTNGQQAVLRKGAADQQAALSTPAPAPEAATRADEQVTLACIARRTVYFEAVEPPGGVAELQPVETVSTNLPTQFTVSPARL